MNLTLSEQIFFDKLIGVLHRLTKEDIKRSLEIWRRHNHPAMFLLSPYRWARASTDFEPRSIYELKQLLESWADIEDKAILSQEQLQQVIKIMVERGKRNSHSTADSSSNSTTMFAKLMMSKSIRQALPKITLSSDMVTLCDDLIRLLDSGYGANLTSSQYAQAKDYLRKMKVFAGDREKAISQLTTYSSYSNRDVFFNYYRGGNRINRERATEIIDAFRNSFINATHKLTACGATYMMFNSMGSKWMPCLVGKSNALFELADTFVQDEQKFTKEDDLMSAILTELELNGSEEGVEYFKQKILAAYEGQTFGDFTIQADAVEKWLHEKIFMDAVVVSSAATA